MADFFGNLGKTLTRATNTAVDKTEDFFTITKIKGRIAEEDRMIDQICCNIGKEIYGEYKEGKELPESILLLCEEIERHEAIKNTQQKDLELLKNK